MAGTLVLFGDGEDRSAGDHDADHPLPQQAGPGRRLAALGGGPSGTARMVSTLPTCRPIMAAARWSTAISPARSAAGSRPASTLGTSTSCPNRPSRGAMVAEARAARPPWPSGSRFRPTTGATTSRQAAGQPRRSSRPGRSRRARRARQRLGGPQETRVGAICPQRPRDRGQHGTPATATSSTSTAQLRHRARSSCPARYMTARIRSPPAQAPARVAPYGSEGRRRSRSPPGCFARARALPGAP